MNTIHSTETNADPQSDRERLNRFFVDGDEVAFAQLVEKHAPLVMGICHRILRDRQEAEDCFQQVFLKLATKGKSIRQHDSLIGWLFTVAQREAVRRSQRRNRQVTTSLENEPMELASEMSSVEQLEIARALQEEVSRLPTTYRGPIVLCYLEGKSREETAQELNASDASIKARLTRGRELLRKRLFKRGLVYGTALAAWQSTSPLSAGLISASLVTQTVTLSTTNAALSTGLMGSSSLSSFHSGVLKVMALSKSSKIGIGVVVVVLALLGVSTALLMSDSSNAPPVAANAPAPDIPTETTAEKPAPRPNRPTPIDFNQLQPYHAAAARFVDAIESQDYDRAVGLMEFVVVKESDRYWESEEFLESYKDSLARLWSAIPEWPLRFTHAFVAEDKALLFTEAKTLRFNGRTVNNATFEVPCTLNEAGEWRAQGIHMESPDVPTDRDPIGQFMQRYPTAQRIELSQPFPSKVE